MNIDLNNEMEMSNPSEIANFRSTTPDTAFESTPHPSPSKSTNANGKRVLQDNTTFQCKRRRAEHLAAAKKALQAWRLETFCRLYSLSSITAVAILPDDNLTTLASDAQIKSLEDMSMLLKPRWILVKKHGQEILDLLKRVDEDEMERRQGLKQAKKEVKDREKEVKRQKKEWDKENEQVRRVRQKEIDRIQKLVGNSSGAVLLPTNSFSISSIFPLAPVPLDVATHEYQQGFTVAPAGNFFSTYQPDTRSVFSSIPPTRFYSNHSPSIPRP
jgi:hypothetical protein